MQIASNQRACNDVIQYSARLAVVDGMVARGPRSCTLNCCVAALCVCVCGAAGRHRRSRRRRCCIYLFHLSFHVLRCAWRGARILFAVGWPAAGSSACDTERVLCRTVASVVGVRLQRCTDETANTIATRCVCSCVRGYRAAHAISRS